MEHPEDLSPITRALRARVKTEAFPAVTPLFQNSAFESQSPFFYTRKANPNCVEFEEVVRILEGAAHAIAVTTGMTAIHLCLELLKPGDCLVINKDIYGCSYKLFQREAAKMSLDLRILDLSTEEGLTALPEKAAMVILETPTNPFLKTIDVARVSKKAKAGNPQALIVVDNTWATPLFQKPLHFGADVSLHSATKYFSGHSDVMGGILLTDSDALAARFRDERFYTGTILDPHSAWLLRRSLQTFPLRMKEHHRVTLEMRDFLKTLPQVEKVYYPEIDGKQLTSYGGILFFELRRDLTERYPDLIRALKLFGTGTGMACVTSMVAQPYTGSHASMTDSEKAEMGLEKNLVRLCFGFEDAEDLRKDLLAAFRAIEKGRAGA